MIQVTERGGRLREVRQHQEDLDLPAPGQGVGGLRRGEHWHQTQTQSEEENQIGRSTGSRGRGGYSSRFPRPWRPRSFRGREVYFLSKFFKFFNDWEKFDFLLIKKGK